ncbi:hypothetical protein VTP01DRAFT_10662 [Rhizomucor pusillus]|uniref:uncharacterized protein n=1 Tax=Rhizomucor pusillus TaxID=4840 RepID=UPI0037424A2B
MTINKSQGQTLDRVTIYLPTQLLFIQDFVPQFHRPMITFTRRSACPHVSPASPAFAVIQLHGYRFSNWFLLGYLEAHTNLPLGRLAGASIQTNGVNSLDFFMWLKACQKARLISNTYSPSSEGFLTRCGSADGGQLVRQ